MAGNVDHGCVHSHFAVSSACRTCVCPQAAALSPSVVGPVSGSRGRLTPPAAASPQSRAVPGPHSRRHRRRLRHGRCRRRHLALREGSLQLSQRTAKQSARWLLGASAHSSAVERRSRCRRRCAFNCRGQRETDALPLLRWPLAALRVPRRCASKRPILAAALLSGVDYSVPSTAHWLPSGKRCVRACEAHLLHVRPIHNLTLRLLRNRRKTRGTPSRRAR